MKKNTYQFTSESVSAGHPDKIADQISDAILDAYLSQDPEAKVACDCTITSQKLWIAGEVNSVAHVDPIAIAKKVLENIGYNDILVGFDWKTAEFQNALHEQSKEIYLSVVDGGAGDQGIMFGHACLDTPEYLPLAISLSHQLVKRLHTLREHSILPWLRPDAKSQVTITYEDGIPISVDTVVISTQHDERVDQKNLQHEIIKQVIEPVLGDWLSVKTPAYFINPSGSFTIGGPHGDTGLTGRKIIVDTYGGSCPHGGGAFSGKDPSKVDRSAAYAARNIAKHLVASGVVSRCTVQLSYAIGVSEPTSIYIDSYGTHRCELSNILTLIRDCFPLKPKEIINAFDLKRPIYFPTASYGHFTNPSYPWEQLNEAILNKFRNLIPLQ